MSGARDSVRRALRCEEGQIRSGRAGRRKWRGVVRRANAGALTRREAGNAASRTRIRRWIGHAGGCAGEPQIISASAEQEYRGELWIAARHRQVCTLRAWLRGAEPVQEVLSECCGTATVVEKRHPRVSSQRHHAEWRAKR